MLNTIPKNNRQHLPHTCQTQPPPQPPQTGTKTVGKNNACWLEQA